MKDPDKMSESELRAVVKAWRHGLRKLATPSAFTPTSRMATDEEIARMKFADQLLEVAEL